MTRSLTPRPRQRRRGRSSAQSEQDERASVAARVLALPNCSYGELGEQWRALWGSDPPRHGSREFLIRAVAYGIQAQAFGGLDAKTLQLLRKANDPNGARPKPQRSRLSRGSKLFREWHGETHEVLVLDKGFAWRGETYPSLSAIARAITGAHWNGWAFFGLKLGSRPRAMLPVAVVGNVDPQMPPERFSCQCARELDEKSSLPLQMEFGGPKSGGILRGIRLARYDQKILLY